MNSGVSHHARKRLTARELAAIGEPCALLGTNRSWTSFAVVDQRDLDAAAYARALGVAIAQIWTSDGHGTTVAFLDADGWSAELPIERGGGGKLSAADKKLLDDLVARRILTEARRSSLARALAAKPRARNAWLDDRGIEKALAVPFSRVMPIPCTAEDVAARAPDARILQPKPKPEKAAAKPKRAAAVSAPTIAASAIPIDPAVLALHVHYWTEIFQMNCWKLYNRYKKYLPAERRREVDQLCDMIALGSEPGVLERAVESILSTVWTQDDWTAAICDPELTEWEPLDPEQLAGWQRRLAAL